MGFATLLSLWILIDLGHIDAKWFHVDEEPLHSVFSKESI